MAYTEKLYAEFRELPSSGRNGTPWFYRLSFREDGYTGAATEVFIYKDRGIKIGVSEGGGALGIFQAINARKMTLKVQARDDWDPRSLYVTSDRQIQVVLQRSTTGAPNSYVDYFYSWLLPAGFKEKYGRKPYAVEVSASCGLSTLKDRPLIDAAGKRLTGIVPLSQIVRNALAQTGIVLPTVVINNLYTTVDTAVGQTVNGRVALDRCPLFNTRVDADTFLTSDGDTQTAYQALERILQAAGMRVVQEGSIWMIGRTEEMAGGWVAPNTPTAVGRSYGTPTLSSAPDGTVTYNFNHTVYPDQAIRAVKGGTVQLNPTVAGIRIEQNYGGFINKLINGNFAQFNSDGFPTGWRKNNVPASGPLRPHVVGTGTEIDPYGLFIYGGGDEKFNKDTPYLAQTLTYPVGSVERGSETKPVKRTLKAKFTLTNTRAAKVVVVAMTQNADGSGSSFHLLQAGGTWIQNPKAKESKGILIYHSAKNASGIIKAKAGFATIDLPMDPLENVAELTIYLCCAEALDQPDAGVTPSVTYYNVRLESEIAVSDIDGRQVTIQTRKTKIDTTLTTTLGDVAAAGSPYDRTSSYYFQQAIPVAIDGWSKPYANILTTTPGPDDKYQPLVNWLAEAYARQALQPVETFEDEILGRLPYGLFTVLRFPDIGPTVSGAVVPSPFIITRWDFYPRECRHEITSVELKSGGLPTGATPVNEWQTPDGPILIDSDAVAPSFPSKPSLQARIDASIASQVGPVTLIAQKNLPTGFTPLDPGTQKLVVEVLKGGVVQTRAYALGRKLLDFNLP